MLVYWCYVCSSYSYEIIKCTVSHLELSIMNLRILFANLQIIFETLHVTIADLLYVYNASLPTFLVLVFIQ